MNNPCKEIPKCPVCGGFHTDHDERETMVEAILRRFADLGGMPAHRLIRGASGDASHVTPEQWQTATNQFLIGRKILERGKLFVFQAIVEEWSHEEIIRRLF